jgi:hypothetical protein
MKHEAGRELDALIAEKVMGWKWYDHTGYAIRYFRPPNRFNYGAIAEGGEVTYLDSLPRYSTDMAAAWEVAETFDAVQVGRAWNLDGNSAGYHCQLDVDNVNAFAETAPLAICRAALLAVAA